MFEPIKRKPLPSEIKEKVNSPNPQGYPGLKKIIYESPICNKCRKPKTRMMPFIKGWDCECKE